MNKVCPPEAADSTLLADSLLSAVVFEHAGDIAAKTDDLEAALRFWNLATQREDQEQVSAVLPKKIKLKKYLKE